MARGTGSDDFDQFLSQKYFPSLDGLRCVSILAVIWRHSASGGRDGFDLMGYLGVDLFFAISGFLITTLLLRERQRQGRISFKYFYIRRTLRIFPLYYAILALYVVVVLAVRPANPADWAARHEFFANLPAYLTYTSNWFVQLEPARRIIFYFGWSLATEEQFYLLWPMVVQVSPRWHVPVIVAAVLIGLDQITEYAVKARILTSLYLPIRIITNIATPILMGCILAYALDRRASYQMLRRVLGGAWSAPLVTVLLIFAVSRPSFPDALMSLLMTCLVGSCVIRDDHLLRPALANPIVRYIGTISYGMYLVHALAMNFAKRLLSGYPTRPLLFVVTVGVAIAAASVTYHVYERPFLRVKNGFRPEPNPSDLAAEPELPAGAADDPVECAQKRDGCSIRD